MIPYHDENETQRPAYVTMLLIAACTLVWVFVQGAGSTIALATSVCNLGLIPGELTGTLRAGVGFSMGRGLTCLTDSGHQYENIMTSMFLHGGWMHLIGNMWFLWIFGDNVEDALGSVRYALFYFAAGTIGALAQVFAMPESTVPMIGASGAVAGALGAYAVLFPRARVHTFVAIPLLWHFRDVQAWIFLGIWFLMQFLLPTGSGVAWMAHVGGFLAGVGLGRVLARRRPAAAAPTDAEYLPPPGRRW